VEKGQKAVVRVVAFKKAADHKGGYFIENIYESHDFDSGFTNKNGTLKAAIANRVIDGLNDLDVNAADKLEIYLIKAAD
jgi:hypothetical protein